METLLHLQMPENPCLTCGACCATLRVSFYWSEAEASLGGKVPLELTEQVAPLMRCMQGTNQKQPRCVALVGEVGQAVGCSIYGNRPSLCRDFGVQWQPEGGTILLEDLERCNRARQKTGLPRLVTAFDML
jgi:uncharacterized protein